MNKKNLLAALSLFAVTSTAQIKAFTSMSVSFRAYDEAAGLTPYYSHYSVTRNENPDFWNGAGSAETVAIINLQDSGWGFNPLYRSSYHVESVINGLSDEHSALRSIGWHQYEFDFDTSTNLAEIFMDGTRIKSGSYSGPLNWFSFNMHGYGASESVIDDFSLKQDGFEVYSQSFDSASLSSSWIITRQDYGSLVSSGDTTNPYNGLGALALSGISGIVFDLNSVPEPSSLILGGITLFGCCLRRNRKVFP